MKTTKTILTLAVALAGFMAADAALAQHRYHRHGPRVVIGLGFGVPLAAYPYYYPPYAYYPPYYPAPVVLQQQPTVYVEQNAQPAPTAPGYWYFCADSRAYYPYVKECASGWQRVSPQPG